MWIKHLGNCYYDPRKQQAIDRAVWLRSLSLKKGGR